MTTPFVYRDKRRREGTGETPWCIAYVGLDGRLHRERTRVRTRELARQVLYKKLEELERAKVSGVTPVQPITLKKFVDEEYLPHVLATKTASYYRSNQISARVVCGRLGQALLSGIHSGTIQKYADERAVAKNRSGERLKPATVNRELMFLSAVFREAVKRRYVERNPVRGIKQLPEDNMIVRWLTDQEEKRLLSFAPPHLKPIILVALHSGMRQGEILGLRWSEVDLDREVIRVVGTKSHKNRFVPMNPVLLATLKGVAPFVGTKGPCPFVFVNPETETRYETLKKVWQATIRKSGIQNFRFHDLRHTFASRLVQRGASLKAVQELLGHADLKMTLRYSHLAPSNLREAVFALVKAAPAVATSRGGKRRTRRA